MPLRIQSDGPSGANEVIAKALGDLGRPLREGMTRGENDITGGDGLSGGGVLEAARRDFELVATAPIPVYRLTEEAVPPASDFGNHIELVGWRYLLLDRNQKAVAYSDVRDAEGATKFVGISEDRNAHFLQLAILQAEEFAKGRTEEFELRLLSLPSVSLALVWLANELDVFIPYADGYVSRNLSLRVLNRDQMLDEVNLRINERSHIDSEGEVSPLPKEQ